MKTLFIMLALIILIFHTSGCDKEDTGFNRIQYLVDTRTGLCFAQFLPGGHIVKVPCRNIPMKLLLVLN